MRLRLRNRPIKYRTRSCSPNRHLWDRDPERARGSAFYRVDCIRCPVKIDAALGIALFDEAGCKLPGRVATDDEKARVVGAP